MPVRSGPTACPSPLCVWHLAHWFLNTTLPAAASPFSLMTAHQVLDHLLPVGAGQGAAAPEDREGVPADAGVRVVGQSLLLVERQVGELELAVVDRARAGRASTRAGRAARRCRPTGRPGSGPASRSRIKAAASGRLAGLQRPEQADRQFRRGLRGDHVEQSRSRAPCRPAGSRPARSRRRRGPRPVAASSFTRASRAFDDLGPGLRRTACCPSRRPAGPAAPAAPGAAGPPAAPGPSRLRRRASAACLGRPALRQPADDRVGDRRVGVRQGGDDRADRIDRAAAGVVLGDDRRPRRAASSAGCFDRGDRPEEVLAVLRGGGRWRRRESSGRSAFSGRPSASATAAPAVGRRRLVGQGEQRHQPDLRRPGRGSARRRGSPSTAFGVARQHLHRVPPHAGRRVLQRRDGRRPSPRGSTRRAPRARAASTGRGSPRRSARSRRPSVSRTSANRAGSTSLLPRSTSSRWACRRQNRLSFSSAATSFSGVAPASENRLPCPSPSRRLVHDAVDAAVLLVAQVALVGGPLAGLEALRRRVVLDDEVVPVEHPDVPVRADLGHDRGGPLVVAGEQVERVGRPEVAAVAAEHERRRPGGRSAR